MNIYEMLENLVLVTLVTLFNIVIYVQYQVWCEHPNVSKREGIRITCPNELESAANIISRREGIIIYDHTSHSSNLKVME